MAGWSAVGGQVRSQQAPLNSCSADQYHQTQSPYIEGGVAENATWFTNTVRSPNLTSSFTSITDTWLGPRRFLIGQRCFCCCRLCPSVPRH